MAGVLTEDMQREEGPVQTEAGTGMMQLRAQNTKGCPSPQKLEKEGKNSPLSWEKQGPLNTLILGF